jgi:hypothetical protein
MEHILCAVHASDKEGCHSPSNLSDAEAAVEGLLTGLSGAQVAHH